jgi:hypothetical protein
MIRFDWRLIKTHCDSDVVTAIRFLRACRGLRYKGKLTKKLRLLSKMGLPRGTSYIVNIDSILQERIASDFEIAQYIGLCSLRNFADYKFNGTTSLPEVMAYKANVQHNRYITLKNRQMHFVHETED